MQDNSIISAKCQQSTQHTDIADIQLSFPDGFAELPTVDWFDFTIHIQPEQKQALPDDRIVRLNERFSVSPADQILFVKSSLAKYFGGGTPRPFGKYRYKSSMSILGGGLILWHEDRPEMGVHVSLSSQALARFAQTSGKTVYELLADMADRGAIATRLDLALDTDTVTIDQVKQAHLDDLLVAKARFRYITQEFDGCKASGGETLYVGSRKGGRRLVRFYNKAAEQGVDGVWTRCEVEFKQEHAITAVMHILSGQDPRSLILSTVDFRLQDNPETDRRSRCDWWQAWVGVVAKVKFPIIKDAATVADKMAWVVKQVGPTLAYLCVYMGNTKWLDDIAKDSIDRVPEWLWDMLPDHRLSGWATKSLVYGLG